MIDTQVVADRSVRVVVMERAEIVRRGICDVLAAEAPLELAAEVSRSDEMPRVCAQLAPDIIVLSVRNNVDYPADLRMLRQLLRVAPAPRAIVLLEHDVVDDVIELVCAGASAVLLRDASARTLVAAIQDVLQGGAALDARLARSLFDRLATRGPLAPAGAAPEMHIAIAATLSNREQEVLRSLARGYRNREISEQLGVSVGTVKTHLRHIFRKLHVADRTAAVLIAIQGRLPEG